MTVYTVSSADDIMSEPLSTLVAGTYTTRGRALDECVAYIMERLVNRQDLAWSMLNDENHPDARRFLVEHRDGTVGVRRGCLGKLKAFIVDTANSSADSANAKLTIKAPTREELNSALCAVGVLHPQDIEPDVVDGEGDKPTGFTATVMLTTNV